MPPPARPGPRSPACPASWAPRSPTPCGKLGRGGAAGPGGRPVAARRLRGDVPLRWRPTSAPPAATARSRSCSACSGRSWGREGLIGIWGSSAELELHEQDGDADRRPRRPTTPSSPTLTVTWRELFQARLRLATLTLGGLRHRGRPSGAPRSGRTCTRTRSGCTPTVDGSTLFHREAGFRFGPGGGGVGPAPRGRVAALALAGPGGPAGGGRAGRGLARDRAPLRGLRRGVRAGPGPRPAGRGAARHGRHRRRPAAAPTWRGTPPARSVRRRSSTS